MKEIELFSIIENKADLKEYLGIGYVKSALEKHEYSVNLNIIISSETNDIDHSFFQRTPDFIGIGIYCNTIKYAIMLSRKIKDLFPMCHLVFGGPEVNECEEYLLSHYSFIDYIITGEAEETFVDLADRVFNNKDINGCLGVTYRYDNKIIKSRNRNLVMDIDSLSFPSRDAQIQHPNNFLHIVGTRGCSGHCTFCCEPSLQKNYRNCIRVRSAENIVDEIEYLQNKFQIHSFHFTDPTFFDRGKEKLNLLFNEIIARQLKIRFIAFARPEWIYDDNIDILKLGFEAGLDCLFLGIESGNDFDLKLYGKRCTLEDNYRSVSILRNIGIYTTFGFIGFNPYSNLKSLISNAKFLAQSGLIYTSNDFFSQLSIQWQTPIRKLLLKDKLIDDDFNVMSDGFKYKFKNNDVEKLLLKYKTKKYMDLFDYTSQIGMDLAYSKRYDIYDCKDLFVKAEELLAKRNDLHGEFISNCLELLERKEDGQIDNLLRNIDLGVYDNDIKSLCYKIQVKMCKLEKSRRE
jgi:radical SAM superfamily enzyme YgiQ (UPF0313 family)